MKNNDDIEICTELGLDADLVQFLGKDGVTLQELQCHHQWRRGYGGADIGRYFGISTEEADASITHIQLTIPHEMLARDTGLRNEILAIKIRSEERSRRFHESLSKPARSYLEAGGDPIKALREYREYINADLSDLIPELPEKDTNIENYGVSLMQESQSIPTLHQETNTDVQHIKASFPEEAVIGEENINDIQNLRRESIRTSVKEEVEGLTPEQENQLIDELRARDMKPAKPITASHARHEFKHAPPEQNDVQMTNILSQKHDDKRTDRRITVRLPPALHERVRQYSKDAGIELSLVVRKALCQFLEGDASKVAASTEMPQEALSLIGLFQTWGSDLREELRLRFLKLLAMSYITRKRWHRADWIRELHAGLLSLYKSLEANDSVGQPRI
jgi:hypothetical protein